MIDSKDILIKSAFIYLSTGSAFIYAELLILYK